MCTSVQNFDGGWFFINQLEELEGPYITRDQAMKAFLRAEDEFTESAFATEDWDKFLIASGVK